jgi:hypothetical protein
VRGDFAFAAAGRLAMIVRLGATVRLFAVALARFAAGADFGFVAATGRLTGRFGAAIAAGREVLSFVFFFVAATLTTG